MSTHTTLRKEFEETLRTTDFEGFLIDRINELEAVIRQYRDNASARMVQGFDFDTGEYPVTPETVSILCAENQRLKAKLRHLRATIDAIANKIGYVPQKTLVPPKEKLE